MRKHVITKFNEDIMDSDNLEIRKGMEFNNLNKRVAVFIG
jgi:hypothetical protein